MTLTAAPLAARPWLTAADCRLDDLRSLLSTSRTRLPDYPLAQEVVEDVLVYDGGRVRELGGDPRTRRELQAELVRALTDGPGLVVVREAFPDADLVSRATAAFQRLIDRQKASGQAVGDHFAKPGSNDRVWNALEKLALADPETFADYYANDVLALVSTAWLGPGYQVTSQVNVVNPGGTAQAAHRDYHLGFLSDAQIERYPAHVHRLSPVLTLQGAVAHCDMPVESGPTMYLPHSHRFEAGYLASGRDEFQDFFDARSVQLPLATGDAAFFNPALIHAAGTNRSADIRRMANLLQVSSAFGRAMESVDRLAVSTAVYPALRNRRTAGADEQALRNVVAAAAEGYPFPTNLDLDPPVGGLAPESQAAVVWRALSEDWAPEVLRGELEAREAKRGTGAR